MRGFSCSRNFPLLQLHLESFFLCLTLLTEKFPIEASSIHMFTFSKGFRACFLERLCRSSWTPWSWPGHKRQERKTRWLDMTKGSHVSSFSLGYWDHYLWNGVLHVCDSAVTPSYRKCLARKRQRWIRFFCFFGPDSDRNKSLQLLRLHNIK